MRIDRHFITSVISSLSVNGAAPAMFRQLGTARGNAKEIQPRTNIVLSGKHQEAGAREVYDHLTGARILSANGDVLR
jgi:hypothetical protein